MQLYGAKQEPGNRPQYHHRSYTSRSRRRSGTDEDALLTALLEEPDRSVADLARACDWFFQSGEPYKSKVQRLLEKLAKVKPKLVTMNRDHWTLTEEGKSAARKAALANRMVERLTTLALNLSTRVNATVAGMDYRDLVRDRDFRRAVENVIDCQVTDGQISC